MRFVKLQASGNDFILVDWRGQPGRDWPALARRLCHRQLGVGGDGLLLVLSSRKADLSMRLFNPDGSEAETSGNGLRCFAKYAVEAGLAPRDGVKVETRAGIKTIVPFLQRGKVARARVNMGTPRLAPKDIPADLPLDITQALDYQLKVGGRVLRASLVSMGNPHAVAFIRGDVSAFPLARLGPLVESHPLFPQRTNFEVARVVSRREIEARVWERGVGETLSCGTGASAIMVAARLLDKVAEEVSIRLPGGTLGLSWDGEGDVYLTGYVEQVFEGEIAEDWL
ncbi:MAG: diaminopimelate epimerase [Chloroflexi bacterium]|nr:diaminopimelate epimerase [Chloroflexota bacterium]